MKTPEKETTRITSIATTAAEREFWHTLLKRTRERRNKGILQRVRKLLAGLAAPTC